MRHELIDVMLNLAPTRTPFSGMRAIFVLRQSAEGVHHDPSFNLSSALRLAPAVGSIYTRGKREQSMSQRLAVAGVLPVQGRHVGGWWQWRFLLYELAQRTDGKNQQTA